MKNQFHKITLAAVLSLAFSCSSGVDDPSSSSSETLSSSSSLGGVGNSSSSEVGGSSSSLEEGNSSSSEVGGSSSSDGVTMGDGSCVSSDMFGVSGIVVCAEYTNVDTLEQRIICGAGNNNAWHSDVCPSGKKITCIDEEAGESYKGYIYVDDFTCRDFGLTNINGGEPEVPMGGACLYVDAEEPESPPTICVSLPNVSTTLAHAICNESESPFVEECPSEEVLVCKNIEGFVLYFYDEALSSLTCSDIGMDDVNNLPAPYPNFSKRLLRSRLLK